MYTENPPFRYAANDVPQTTLVLSRLHQTVVEVGSVLTTSSMVMEVYRRNVWAVNVWIRKVWVWKVDIR